MLERTDEHETAFDEMSGVILPADRNRLQRNRFLPAGDELATYFAEAELCVEAGGRWIRRVEVELTSDYRDRRRLGVREGCSIQLRTKALAFDGVGNDDPVDVQELAIALPSCVNARCATDFDPDA